MNLVVDNLNYDDFLKIGFTSGNFLQSTIWKDFLKAQKIFFWQLIVKENSETLAVCLVYENKLFFSRSYLYSPKGPIFSKELNDEQKKEAIFLILSKMRDVTIATKKYEEIFYKLEPADYDALLPEFIKASDVQPRDSLILDLTKNHQQLLGEMHAKTRYNIGLAQRKGVRIKFSHQEEDIKYFLKLIKKTAKKNQITVHSDDYYKLLYQTLLKHQAGQLCLAYVDNKIVVVNLILRFGSAATYLHGAADYKFRAHMAPQLLQWETIKQSKELGYKIYDFWGITPDDNSKPGWEGFTRFKKGFGGQIIKAPGTHNFVYHPAMYKFYLLANKVRNILK
ncbi:MAG: hypothetical protein COV55_03650 [Candidatus Komeilibacteria bacterium CG11_big_fil_rev_8_21_14_0_20_36_20]|uniref:BioF2-like acetyltransferase domain-containing protein n=1 Tax=Candidatus Komeilibacteria bacterium CG11_big_fil_rev_8_21_14_0_20_36_20 TaxID=1974477 RepID=A0A2H0NCG9_9BACT|nr:MAG: hypothetical protein COV55_03650 [Candidatus Komeilibacteria bacterium CG11_big_fil_rev_8_21_14_0_20_36_20]PIR81924.1 MAG: hypothetical protein COU21_01095 [Candidatus Komeilibacteria bacterium CG10_big_fil_rev_8_21_14_0_10_36_65]PJC55349.1 MAG: hypothetical protein CO027_02350 [Candidatus Komeilibacteria bacterium CG_4_9_14_0_2_um_filter_36_13]